MFAVSLITKKSMKAPELRLGYPCTNFPSVQCQSYFATRARLTYPIDNYGPMLFADCWLIIRCHSRANSGYLKSAQLPKSQWKMILKSKEYFDRLEWMIDFWNHNHLMRDRIKSGQDVRHSWSTLNQMRAFYEFWLRSVLEKLKNNKKKPLSCRLIRWSFD